MVEFFGSQKNSPVQKQETLKTIAEEDNLIEVFKGYFCPADIKRSTDENEDTRKTRLFKKELGTLIKEERKILKQIFPQLEMEKRIKLQELLIKALNTNELVKRSLLQAEEVSYLMLAETIGGESLVQDIYNEIPITCNTSDDKQNAQLYHLTKLNTLIDAGPMIVPIAGVSLSDFLNKERLSKLSFTQLFQFLAESYAVNYGLSPKDRVNSDYPIKEASSWTVSCTNMATDFVTNGTPLSLKRINEIETGATGLKRKAAKRAKELMQYTQNLREKACKIAFDPDQPEFQELKSALMPYLQKNNIFRAASVLSLGINTFDKMFSLYRKASVLMKGAHPQFYHLLASSIRMIARQLRDAGFSVATQEELEKIRHHKEASQTSSAPLWMQETITNITQIAHKSISQAYQPDLHAINWQELKPAQTIKLTFDQNNPDQCFLVFVWNHPDQENNIEIKFMFDINKRRFSWNVLDMPSQVPQFFCPFTFIIPSALSNIRDQVNTAFQKKETHIPAVKNDYKKEEISPSVSANLSFDEERVDIAEYPIKDYIKPLDNKRLTHLTSRMPSYLKGNVEKILEKYHHEEGAGIKKLKATKSDKKPLYALRIGNVRCLLSEDKSSATQDGRSFQIENIDFRKDIYQKIFRR